MKAFEANFDGLVGPTHNYAGLSYGNVASMSHKLQVSNPREAALQGLHKMKALTDKGFVQGVLAPQSRPDLDVLRQLGFTGSDEQVLKKAFKDNPAVLASVFFSLVDVDGQCRNSKPECRFSRWQNALHCG